jgi:diguanylate cyclase (GGDEF)-like protein
MAINTASSWIPLPSWAVVAADQTGHLSILAERCIVPEMAVALSDVAGLVLRERRPVSSAGLQDDRRVATTFVGAMFAVPLQCRGECVGELVGFDRRPSSRAPRLTAATQRRLELLLVPVASALDKTLLLRRMEALSVTDDLTRLYNSRYLNQVLRRESKRAVRTSRPLSLLFIDLDGFKLINDTYGHLSGSQALVEAAAVIRGSARETDIAARFGGDEFALILPDTGSIGAVAVAERVCERIATHIFLAEQGTPIRLTASVGVATLPGAASSPEELVQAADSAMYHVKDRGKNGLQAAKLSTDK